MTAKENERKESPFSDFRYKTPDHPFHESVALLNQEEPLNDQEITKKNDFRMERVRVCLEVLRTDKAKRKRILVIRKLVHGSLLAFAPLALKFGATRSLPPYSFEVLIFLNMCLYFFPEAPTSDEQTSAIHELALYADLPLSGVFVEELSNGSYRAALDVEKLLTGLLSRFSEHDSQLLNQRQRRLLLAYLGGRPYTLFAKTRFDFRLAILHAMSVVGDSHDLLQIEAIAKGKYCGQDCPELAKAAQESVFRMKARFLKSKESDSLLRASSRAISPANELLKPNKGDSAATKKELLRLGE